MKTRDIIMMMGAWAVMAVALAGCEKTKRGPYDCPYEVQP